MLEGLGDLVGLLAGFAALFGAAMLLVNAAAWASYRRDGGKLGFWAFLRGI